MLADQALLTATKAEAEELFILNIVYATNGKFHAVFEVELTNAVDIRSSISVLVCIQEAKCNNASSLLSSPFNTGEKVLHERFQDGKLH